MSHPHEHAWVAISAFGQRCSSCGEERFEFPASFPSLAEAVRTGRERLRQELGIPDDMELSFSPESVIRRASDEPVDVTVDVKPDSDDVEAERG